MPSATASQPPPNLVAHNKLWLEILVQKPNHKGDAVNPVDLVCDGVKKAVPVDDRWFCIRRLDWQIVKESPRLYIGIEQEDVGDAQVCSACGVIKPFDGFGTQKANLHGINRTCRECRAGGRKLAPDQLKAHELCIAVNLSQPIGTRAIDTRRVPRRHAKPSRFCRLGWADGLPAATEWERGQIDPIGHTGWP